MMSPEKKALSELLKLYKELPCLWDPNNSLYTNKEARRKAHNLLVDNFKTYQDDADVDLIKRKLENMRTAYKRELRKMRAAKSKGLKKHPLLWYFDLMTFIDNDTTRENSIDIGPTKVELEDEESEPGEFIFDTLEVEQQEPKRMKISEVYLPSCSSEDTLLNKNVNTNKKCPNRLNNEAMSFGRTVGLQLKELDKLQRTIAEKIISDTIFYARMKKLTSHSKINLN